MVFTFADCDLLILDALVFVAVLGFSGSLVCLIAGVYRFVGGYFVSGFAVGLRGGLYFVTWFSNVYGVSLD